METIDQPTEDDLPADALFTINHVFLRYTIIPVFFLLLGIIIGVAGHDRLQTVNRQENEALIKQAVAAALDRQPNQVAQSDAGTSTNSRFDVSVDDDPALGPEDAPVIMIEFSDFKCPYCGRFARETLHPLLEAYEGQIRFVYRDFPILGQISIDAALAAECADEQDAFWDYHDLLFENQARLDPTVLVELAATLEIDIGAFTACIDEERYQDDIIADYSAAQQTGARGTPAFFINGRFVSGAQPYEVFAAMIEEELGTGEAEG